MTQEDLLAWYEEGRREREAETPLNTWRGIPLEAERAWAAAMPDHLRSARNPYPSSVPFDIHYRDSVGAFHQREYAQLHYAWAVPTAEALEELSKLAPLVEIGAGGGYWAYLLQQGGVDIVAYDKEPGLNEWVAKLWTDVRVGGPECAAHHAAERSLFLSWPPYGDDMAARSLELHRERGGRFVAYIGEWHGCTADDRFHALLSDHYQELKYIALPQWWALHDGLYILERQD